MTIAALQTNVPAVCRVAYANTMETQHGERLLLNGDFPGGDTLFLDPGKINDLVALGILTGDSKAGKTQKGKDKMQWTVAWLEDKKSKKFVALKSEGEGNKHYIELRNEDGTEQVATKAEMPKEVVVVPLTGPDKGVPQTVKTRLDEVDKFESFLDWAVTKTQLIAKDLEVTDQQALALIFDRILSNAAVRNFDVR